MPSSSSSADISSSEDGSGLSLLREDAAAPADVRCTMRIVCVCVGDPDDLGDEVGPSLGDSSDGSDMEVSNDATSLPEMALMSFLSNL